MKVKGERKSVLTPKQRKVKRSPKREEEWKVISRIIAMCRELSDSNKHNNIGSIGVPEEEETENLFEGIITEKFPNPDTQIQEA